VVLIGASMLSVLVEIGFVSNPREEQLLKKPDYRLKLAESLYKGLSKYAESLSDFQVAQPREWRRIDAETAGRGARTRRTRTDFPACPFRRGGIAGDCALRSRDRVRLRGSLCRGGYGCGAGRICCSGLHGWADVGQ